MLSVKLTLLETVISTLPSALVTVTQEVSTGSKLRFYNSKDTFRLFKPVSILCLVSLYHAVSYDELQSCGDSLPADDIGSILSSCALPSLMRQE